VNKLVVLNYHISPRVINVMTIKMQWHSLLNTDRLGVKKESAIESGYENYFSDDKDRVLFSKETRLLQGKTQVFSLLAAGEYVRNRFSHSLEVSSVGRRIGNIIKGELHRKNLWMAQDPKFDFPSVIESACLCHDIGHPPLAHVGESAIRLWFKESPLAQHVFEKMDSAGSGHLKNDFLRYEGNAQNFRLLSRLIKSHKRGGLQLTLGTLATVAKYPCSANFAANNKQAHSGFKKHGFFADDRELFTEVAEGTGLISASAIDAAWYRHPLSYVVEAADDICYSVIDIEDAVWMGCVGHHDAIDLIIKIAGVKHLPKLKAILSNQGKIEEIRELAVKKMICEVASVFVQHEDDFLTGQFDGDILSKTSYAADVLELKRFAEENIYVSRPALSIRTSGYAMIEGLLNGFVGALEDMSERGESCSSKSKMIVTLADSLTDNRGKVSKDPYSRLLSVTDMISSMTDKKAIEVYKIISGQSLASL